MMQSVFFKPVSMLLIALLGFAGISASMSLAAAIIARPAQQLIKEHEKRPEIMSSGEWQAVFASLEQARNYQPDNPGYLQMLGNAGLNQYLYASSTNKKARAARQEAADYFQQAISARPSWPHDHVNYVVAKYRIGEIDDDFFRHLQQANSLGAWEPWVQQVTAEMGLLLDGELPSDIQALSNTSIYNGVRHPDGMRGMLDILRRYNRLDQVCNDAPNQGVEEYCRRYQ